jgi:Ni/Fe-hydrogenase 1 B-type cytochrome subunit
MKIAGIQYRPADPTRSSPETVKLIRVYVWDVIVRVCHWSVVLSVFVLAFTGFYIGNPYVSVPGEARDHFVTGTFKTIHFYAATVFGLALVVRIWWSFVGTGPARWPNYIPVTERRFKEMKETLKFYLFVGKRFPPVLSHNPLAGITYTVVLLLLCMMSITGLAMYGASAHVDSPFRLFAGLSAYLGGLQWVRWMHHAGMWLILGFFVHHLYSALLASVIEKNGILESIFTGFKWVRAEEVEKE